MSGFFVGVTAGPTVVARSRARLQFEPRGPMKDWRSDIAASVRRLSAGGDELLHAVYGSPVDEDCDAENILFYNVGTGAFGAAARRGPRFERRFVVSAEAAAAGALHEHTYRLSPGSAGFEAWRLAAPIARIGPLAMPPIVGEVKPAPVWLSIAEGRVEPLGAAVGQRFAVVMELEGPLHASFNAVAVIKGLLDGVLSALHVHSNAAVARGAAARLAPVLGRTPAAIGTLLTRPGRSVLGPRPVVHLRGAGVQWNPADHLCFACELRVRPGAEAVWRLSGGVHLVEPTGSVPALPATPLQSASRQVPRATTTRSDPAPRRRHPLLRLQRRPGCTSSVTTMPATCAG